MADEEAARTVPPTVGGRYLIHGLLHESAMNVVFAARDRLTDRRVAIKVTERSWRCGYGPTTMERLQREAVALATISHPNIVRVLDSGFEGEGTYYLALEWLEGPTLHELLETLGHLPSRLAVALIIQLLDALEAAHAAKVVHRDVKPSNILLTCKGLKLIDFGLAALMTGCSDWTEDLHALTSGTVGYMSPEQCYGESLDGRSDLFNVGLILYRMLTGRWPFPGARKLKEMRNVIAFEKSAQGRDIPNQLGEIAMKALSWNPADRFGSAAEMRDALQAVPI